MTYAELEKERQRLLPTHDHKYFMLIAPEKWSGKWHELLREALQEEELISPTLLIGRNDLDLFFFRRTEVGVELMYDILAISRLRGNGPPNE